MATIDDIINGSFAAVGAPPPYITPGYNPADYSSLYAPAAPRGNGMWGSTRPTVTSRPAYSPYMTAVEKAQLEKQVAESKALQATMGKTPTAVATGPAWNQPTSIDLAAIEAQNRPKATVGPTLDDLLAYAQGLPDKVESVNPALSAATAAGAPVTNVTGKMQPTSRGGLFEILAGLFGGTGGQGGGGLAGLLGGGNVAPAKTGPTGVGTNGYTYVNGQNMGYSDAEKATRAAQGQAIGDANRKNPNPTYSKSGENNAFMPKSYQNSVRQQTGY